MRRILLLVPVIVLSLASTLAAQPAQGAPDDKSWLTPTVALVAGILVILVSIKKSKREHRD